MSDFNKIVETLQLKKESNIEHYNFKTKEYDGMTRAAFVSCINNLLEELEEYSEKKGLFYHDAIDSILSEFEQFPRYKDLSIFKEFVENNL